MTSLPYSNSGSLERADPGFIIKQESEHSVEEVYVCNTTEFSSYAKSPAEENSEGILDKDKIISNRLLLNCVKQENEDTEMEGNTKESELKEAIEVKPVVPERDSFQIIDADINKIYIKEENTESIGRAENDLLRCVKEEDIKIEHSALAEGDLFRDDNIVQDVNEGDTDQASDEGIHSKEERQEYENRPFACNFCSKRFSQKKYLMQHGRVHSDNRPFSCQTCGKSFLRKDNLKNHERTHTKERPFECPICNKKFTQRFVLNNHRATHAEERPFPCPTCGKRFAQKQSLQHHQVTHSSVHPFQCRFCGKRVKRKHDLKVHEAAHDKRRPFLCLECKKSFALEAQLAHHACDRDGDDGPFVCGVCDKVFLLKLSLERHVVVHSERCPFKCAACDKVFANKSSLDEHALTHSGARPHQCALCGKMFRQKSSLWRHKRTNCVKQVQQRAENERPTESNSLT